MGDARDDRSLDDRVAFVRAHSALGPVPGLPELRLHLATEVTPLWGATEAWLASRGVPPPFWAFAWAGGVGLARYVLDHPELVAGARVVDFACGGGVVAIAAAMAGAPRVEAVDVDPFAIAAVRVNAAANGVEVHAEARDPLGDEPPAASVLLAGDVFYDRAMTARVGPWLRAAAAAGTRVVVGDPGRTYVPRSGVRVLAEMDVVTTLDLEGTSTKRTRVLAIE
jgi:predicted nicotinamide N-methyase